MLNIQENISLKSYNTFGFAVKSHYFVEVNSVEQLREILRDERFLTHKKMFLGGGSNVLFLKDFEGLVVKINFKGIEILNENEDFVILKAGSGENWNDLVQFAVNKNWGGIENLSLIPGTVGAAPMQNIGAYGVEIKDVFQNLEALNLETLTIENFNNAQCAFGYRESFFKHEGKGKYVILNVSFRLSKKPEFKTSYGDILKILEQNGGDITVKSISDAVIHIRQSKLPDPKVLGNSGSFFKNPEIAKRKYEVLQKEFPTMPGYIINENTVKVPAGWLIEQAGWKGKRMGNVGVHDKQALVLVNFGEGTGQEIKILASEIQNSVLAKFSIEIYPEVNYIE